MDYKKWDIFLIKFPFTDLSNYKLRPALVISNWSFNKNDNIMLIWIYLNRWLKDYSMEIDQDDLKEWKMKKQSYFRFQNIFSLDKNLVERKVAELKNKQLDKIKDKFCDFLG